MRLGDLVSVAFRAYRRNWRYFSGRLFGPSLLASIAVSMIQISIVNVTQAIRSNNGMSATDGGLMVGGLLIASVCQFVLSLRATALYRQVFLFEEYKDALQYAKRRKWTVFTIFTLGSVLPFVIGMLVGALLVGFVVMKSLHLDWLMIPLAFISGILVVVATALALLVTTMLFAVVSHENIKFLDVIKRAFQVSFLYPMRGGSYICLLAVSLFMLLIACTIFLTPLEIYEGVFFVNNPDHEMPMYLRVLEAASQTVNNIVSMAIAIVAAGLYYRDVLFKSEGADLVERIDSLQRVRVDRSS